MMDLRIENLTLAFGGVKALNDVTFHVEPGEIYAIIGPNGAGKSTIFNAISRIYTPDEGSITYGNKNLLALGAHQVVEMGIARTFQNIELFEKATVLQNLLVGRHSRTKRNWLKEFFFLSSVRKAEHKNRVIVEEILELLDMQQYRDEKVADLPYGARKNVELARALCASPKLLLLDEPASGLNPEETTDMAFWLKDIKEQLGVTIIMVEHDMNLVRRMADRVLAINNGEMLAIGTVDEVQGNLEVQSAYLGGSK
jgi:branched-chain amino acid transport system ATP-binding protein